MGRLCDYAHDITSQNGEDGMLAELLVRLAMDGGWCVELGAWDGKHLSNTWSLWNSMGWSAVLIEGDTDRAAQLADSTKDLGRVHILESYAEARTDRSLDSLFARTPLPYRFEVLSIDVDGDDYYLWEDLTAYRPRVVIVEYNVSFEPGIEFVQEPGQYIGSSALSLVKLANTKGYALAGLTQTNLLFVDAVSAPALTGLETDLAILFDRDQLPVVYSDFAGHHYILRPAPWGYTGASRHGDPPFTQLTYAAAGAIRRVRRSAGEAKHAVAVQVPSAARIVKAVRRLVP